MSLLAVTPTQLTPGGLAPTDITTPVSSLGSDTGITFPNDGRTIVIVVTGSGVGGTTVESDIPIQVQGEQVPAQSFTQPLSTTKVYGPFPSQFDEAGGIIEIDFGTPANVTGLTVLKIPGVI